MANPSDNFKITPREAFSQYNEFNFSNLYLHHTYSGPDRTQATIIRRDSATGQGETAVNNWKIYDGVGPDAKVVARAQGLHIFAGKWRCGFSIVFENERFNGSTLEVAGVTVERGEWAIVGGTGEFKMATGVIYKKTHESNSNGDIIELTVHGFYPDLVKHLQLKSPYKTGPWGSDSQGAPWDVKETPVRLVDRITINHGHVVDRIEFSYVDQGGEKRKEQVGGGGGTSSTILLTSKEYLVEVSGHVGVNGAEVSICQITFVTNIRTYGPFGKGVGSTSSFSTRAKDGYNIAGFYGRNSHVILAIGCYMHPL